MVLSSNNMLLTVLYELANGTSKKIRFEDIVVAAFKKYPQHFQLRGYPEYPDAGDAVHRPLYNLKKKGLLDAKEKYFSLTEQGKVFAEKILGFEKKHGIEDRQNFERDIEDEIRRIFETEAFKLFAGGKREKILDSDFYSYLGVTVRTERTSFLARLDTLTRVAEKVRKRAEYKIIGDLHDFLLENFKSIIEYKRNQGRRVL